MRILVSACLTGVNCKYNGGNNYNEAVVNFIKGHEVIEVCPEVLGGLGVPRKSAEIVNGVVMTKDHENVDEHFRKGVAEVLEMIKDKKIDMAILQSRSPSCGVNKIYDGTFTGNLTDGMGVFAEALIKSGIMVVDAEDIANFQC